MSGIRGFDCVLCLDDAILGIARNVKLLAQAGTAQVTSRAGAGWHEYLQTLKNWRVEIEHLWVPTDALAMALHQWYLSDAESTMAVRMIAGPYFALAAWQAAHATVLGEQIYPVGKNCNWAYVYEATDLGEAPHETGAEEPEWPTTPDETVEDGDITWTCRLASPVWLGSARITNLEQPQPLEGAVTVALTLTGTEPLSKVNHPA
jgi:hypothetical protein